MVIAKHLKNSSISGSSLFFYIDNLTFFSLKLLVRVGFKSMLQILVEGKMLQGFLINIILKDCTKNESILGT